ncbi:MAG: RluA family pseudouridine synthase [Verrucomicrobia bacterium]|nr:MAG: RluA family pseudouridine synthase [Verrucomicrobiota bacterium]
MDDAPSARAGESIEFVVPEEADEQRVDKVLTAAFPQHSRAAFHRLFADDRIRRGDAVLSKSDRVRSGESVSICFPEARPSELTPVEMDLEVLFEDRAIVVINKRAGLTVHPGAGTRGDTLVHGLLAHCRGDLSGIGGVERPGIVHRLDRETSGVLVVAKTDLAHRGLAEQFSRRSLRKEYLALVRGVPPDADGRIDSSILRHPTQRHRMTVGVGGRARASLTEWHLERAFSGGFSLLKCRIHTGRTHQIRVHLSSIKYPVLGDSIYGFRPRVGDPMSFPRVLLHAAVLEFTHPMDGRRLTIEAPLPDDFREVLARLGADDSSTAETEH